MFNIRNFIHTASPVVIIVAFSVIMFVYNDRIRTDLLSEQDITSLVGGTYDLANGTSISYMKPTEQDMKSFEEWLDTFDSSNCGFIEIEIRIFSGSNDETRILFRDMFIKKYNELCLDNA